MADCNIPDEEATMSWETECEGTLDTLQALHDLMIQVDTSEFTGDKREEHVFAISTLATVLKLMKEMRMQVTSKQYEALGKKTEQ